MASPRLKVNRRSAPAIRQQGGRRNAPAPFRWTSLVCRLRRLDQRWRIDHSLQRSFLSRSSGSAKSLLPALSNRKFTVHHSGLTAVCPTTALQCPAAKKTSIRYDAEEATLLPPALERAPNLRRRFAPSQPAPGQQPVDFRAIICMSAIYDPDCARSLERDAPPMPAPEMMRAQGSALKLCRNLR